MADSVRVPTSTVSLIILNLTFQTPGLEVKVNREVINDVYRDAAAGSQKSLLVYTDEQNVPMDMVGMRAAVVLEAAETHTRTGFVNLDLAAVPELADIDGIDQRVVPVPVTHAKLFGWYDNEYGSYTNMLGELTVHVHRRIS
jgi:glyceraldehyde 3-phosphate dehydrogenase